MLVAREQRRIRGGAEVDVVEVRPRPSFPLQGHRRGRLRTGAIRRPAVLRRRRRLRNKRAEVRRIVPLGREPIFEPLEEPWHAKTRTVEEVMLILLVGGGRRPI